MSFVRVALDVPVPTLFDYRASDVTNADIGRRVLVPFGKKVALGVIIEIARTTTLLPQRVRSVLSIMRDAPPLPPDILALLKFCSDYYHHPLGETVLNALPTRLRRRQALTPKAASCCRLTVAGRTLDLATLPQLAPGPSLNDEQSAAVDRVRSTSDGYTPWLLFGVTGGGKTEVYLRLIANTLAAGRQTLLLVPEINLTPQLEALVRTRFPVTKLAVLHSGLSESERLHSWLAAQSGASGIVLGTRLAVFTPLPRLGLIVVDEEHDASFKQMDGLRYSARDLALVRAKQRAIPIVLGSATPALETFHKALTGSYHLLKLTQRINAMPPTIECVDTRRESLVDGLSQTLLTAVRNTLKRGEQSLIFINRRGYAPVLMCRGCGWISGCHRCSARLVLHLADQRLRCHHCGHQERVPAACPQCGNQDLVPLGQGTQRVESTLARIFPAARTLRIDRDSTRRKHAWREMHRQIHEQGVDILVGTQIIAKGHDFPQLNLVGVINADSSLYSTDFRAAERLFARLTQVAGRAGRGARRGRVFIQTEFPAHPLYQALCRDDYPAHAQELLAERKQAGFPPFVHQALLRAEAPKLSAALGFLSRAAHDGAKMSDAVTIYDPVPAGMPRLAGLERAQLTVESRSRQSLHAFLRAWRVRLDAAAGHNVRWALDVDPLEL